MIWDVILPRSRAFSLTIDKKLRQFFEGLNFNDDFRDDADSVVNNIDPYKTNNLEKWEDQFYLRSSTFDEDERRDRLAASWKMTGGQSPYYLQSVLRSFGFDATIYEWWGDGGEDSSLAMGGDVSVMGGGKSFMAASFGIYPTARNPNEILIDDYYMMVNQISSSRTTPLVIPTDANQWRHFIYVAGTKITRPAYIDEDRRDEFEELILSIFPASKYIGMIISYDPPPNIDDLIDFNPRYDLLSADYLKTTNNIPE